MHISRSTLTHVNACIYIYTYIYIYIYMHKLCVLFKDQQESHVLLKDRLPSPSHILHFASAVVEEVAQIILGYGLFRVCGFRVWGLGFRVCGLGAWG